MSDPLTPPPDPSEALRLALLDAYPYTYTGLDPRYVEQDADRVLAALSARGLGVAPAPLLDAREVREALARALDAVLRRALRDVRPWPLVAPYELIDTLVSALSDRGLEVASKRGGVARADREAAPLDPEPLARVLHERYGEYLQVCDDFHGKFAPNGEQLPDDEAGYWRVEAAAVLEAYGWAGAALGVGEAAPTLDPERVARALRAIDPVDGIPVSWEYEARCFIEAYEGVARPDPAPPPEPGT